MYWYLYIKFLVHFIMIMLFYINIYDIMQITFYLVFVDNLAEKVFCICIQEYFMYNESLYSKLNKPIDGTLSIKFNRKL